MIFISQIKEAIYFDFYYYSEINNQHDPSSYCCSFGNDDTIGLSFNEVCYHASRKIHYTLFNQRFNTNKSKALITIIKYTYIRKEFTVELKNIKYHNIYQFYRELYKNALLNLLPFKNFIQQLRNTPLGSNSENSFMFFPLDRQSNSISSITDVVNGFSEIIKEVILIKAFTQNSIYSLNNILIEEQYKLIKERRSLITEIELIINIVKNFETHPTYSLQKENSTFFNEYLSNLKIDSNDYINYLKLNLITLKKDALYSCRILRAMELFKFYNSEFLTIKLEALKAEYKNIHETINNTIDTIESIIFSITR